MPTSHKIKNLTVRCGRVELSMKSFLTQLTRDSCLTGSLAQMRLIAATRESLSRGGEVIELPIEQFELLATALDATISLSPDVAELVVALADEFLLVGQD